MSAALLQANSVAQLAAALVRIPSINPEAAPEENPALLGEARLAAALANLLESWGAEVELTEVSPHRPNLLARFPANRPGKPKLLLAPHLDTVPVSGMTIAPFSGETRDGRLHGRGACDTKGPMAAMLWAIRSLQQTGELARSPWEVHFAAFMGEEVGQPGSAAFGRRLLTQPPSERYAFALIGEPTERQFVHAHKGNCWLELSAQGRAAHASRPKLGDNALWHLIQALEDLRQHWWPEFAREQADHLLGQPVWNLGTMQGGQRPNIVPAEARAVLNIRLSRAGSVAPCLQAWLDQRQHPVSVRETDLSPPLRTPTDQPALQQLAAACQRPLTTAPWFCDAGTLADLAAVPAAAYGPGSIDQAHTADEWLDLGELEAAVTDITAMLRG